MDGCSWLISINIHHSWMWIKTVDPPNASFNAKYRNMRGLILLNVIPQFGTSLFFRSGRGLLHLLIKYSPEKMTCNTSLQCWYIWSGSKQLKWNSQKQWPKIKGVFPGQPWDRPMSQIDLGSLARSPWLGCGHPQNRLSSESGKHRKDAALVEIGNWVS